MSIGPAWCGQMHFSSIKYSDVSNGHTWQNTLQRSGCDLLTKKGLASFSVKDNWCCWLMFLLTAVWPKVAVLVRLIKAWDPTDQKLSQDAENHVWADSYHPIHWCTPQLPQMIIAASASRKTPVTNTSASANNLLKNWILPSSHFLPNRFGREIHKQ